MKQIRRHGLKIVGTLLILGLIAISLPQGKAFLKTAIILPEFIPNLPVKTINLLTGKPQVKEVIIYSKDLRRIDADLWLPKVKGKYPAAVLHLGVDIDRKDERVQKLASALSRGGIATLVPNIPSLNKRRILPETKDDLITSFEYLKSHQSVRQDKVGFIAFCASAGLVLLASEKPEIASEVSFVIAVNPYFDLSSLYENLTIRKIKDNNAVTLWQPHFKTVEIFNRETIGLLEDESERKTLTNYLVKIPTGDLERGNFPSLSQKELERLSKEAKFTWEYLTNRDPGKLSFYKESITSAQKKLIADLSPSTNIQNLKAKTFILADVNNVYIPFTEAQSLDNALRGKEHLFFQTKILPTGDLVKSLSPKDSLIEGARIFRFLYAFFLETSQ